MTARSILHLVLHLLVPGAVAWAFWRARWLHAWLILVATMIVDLDHLLATPLYDPNRCSIFFHPLHSRIAIVFYLAGLLWRRTRIVATGLVIHMGLDFIDCLWMRWESLRPAG